MRVTILQIKDIEKCPYAFMDFVDALDSNFDPNDYQEVYSYEFNPRTKNIKTILNYIFNRFNEDDKPKEFKGHSLSVSDMVIIDNKEIYYCNSKGWESVL